MEKYKRMPTKCYKQCYFEGPDDPQWVQILHSCSPFVMLIIIFVKITSIEFSFAYLIDYSQFI